MLGILQRNGITDANCARNIATCPVKLFFLTPEFIRDNWDLAKLPAERLPETIAFAGMIQNSLRYRQLAWHLFQNFAKVSLNTQLQHKFPDIIDELGIDSGKLYLLLALSLIPYNRQRAELEGFPVRYADAAADRIGTTIRYFACKFDGAFGLLGSGLYFLMHFKETATYRIGRFDFVVFRNSSTPYIYGSGARTIAFCGNNWLLNRTGERVESRMMPSVSATLFPMVKRLAAYRLILSGEQRRSRKPSLICGSGNCSPLRKTGHSFSTFPAAAA